MTTDAAIVVVLNGVVVVWTPSAIRAEVQRIALSLGALEEEFGWHQGLDAQWAELDRLSVALTGVLPLTRDLQPFRAILGSEPAPRAVPMVQ